MLAKILNNPLLRQSLWSIIARFVGVGLNFGVAILITRQLPESEAGILFLLMTFVTGFALFSRIGIDQLLMKEVASSHEDEQSFRCGYLRSTYKFVVLLSIIFTIIWIVTSPWIRSYFFDGEINLSYLMFAGIGIFFFNVVILNSTYLKAIQNTIIAVLSQNALPAISFLIMLALFWNSFNSDQLYINLYTASLVLAGLIAISLTKRHLSTKDEKKTQGPRFKHLLEKAIPLAPVSIFSFLMIFADTIMVGLYLPNEDVALYSVAARVSFIILFFLGALEATIYPRLLNIYKQQPTQLKSFFWQATALVIGVVLTVTTMMYLLSDWILFVFGESYAEAKKALGLLLIAQFLRAASITFSFMFIIREKVRYLNIILVLALVINLVCNVIFIQKYGIEGAALATLISNGVLLFSILTLFMTNKLLTSLAIPIKNTHGDKA